MSVSISSEKRSAEFWWRLAGALGLAWFVLFVIGGVVLHGQPPAYDEPIEKARQYFHDNAQQYLVGDYIVRLGFVFGFLPFVAGLQSRLGAGEGEPRILSRLIFGAGLATFVIGDASKFFLNAVALGGGSSEISDSTIRTLLYADSVSIATIGVPAALLALTASWLIWTTGALWRWIAVLGLVAGGLLVVGAAFPLGRSSVGILFGIRFASFIALALFVVACSLSMLLGRGAAMPQPRAARRGTDAGLSPSR
jgi:hypothetical protein